MMNRFAKLAGIAGLTTLTAMASLGLGTINVLADEAKLPAYVMDGTNAERAISDYFVNNYDNTAENSVVIPHMDIMKTQDNGSSLNVYGAYTVAEYTQDGSALVMSSASATEGCFTLNKNQDGTYTVADYKAVKDDASKEDVVEVFGKELGDEAFAVYCNDGGTDLWNAILAEDAAYYSYDNKLGLDRIVGTDDAQLKLAGVDFSTDGAHTMFVQEDANVRSAGTKASTAFDGICGGEKITVTGMANGWGRVTVDGRTGYIASSLLGESKPEKKAEKKAEEVKTGYTVGRIESYTGSSVSINGYTAAITKETKLEGGEMRVGDLAKLTYKEVNGKLIATELLTQGDPREDLAIAPDGRVVDTGNHYGLIGDGENEDVVVIEDGDAICDPGTEMSPEEVEAAIASANNDANEEEAEEVYVEIEE